MEMKQIIMMQIKVDLKWIGNKDLMETIKGEMKKNKN